MEGDGAMAHHGKGWRHGLAVLTASVLLGACGGGGGGGSDDGAPVLEAPPTAAATLQASASDARSAAITVVSGAQRLVELSAGLSGSAAPLSSSGASPAMLGRRALAATRESALAVQTLSCTDFFGPGSCSGSVTVDTNATNTGSVVPAGTYVTLTFNALQGSIDGSSVRLDGALRMDYLTSFDLDAETLANVRFQLTLDDFEGLEDGVSFGPLSEVALFAFDSTGEPALTVDGLRIVGFDNLTVTDEDNFTLANVLVRRAHWAQANGYVDAQFTGWSVVAGRPTVNSQTNLTAGGDSVLVRVQASSAQTVVYRVAVTISGVVTTYDVTAAYPAGGGAPTYTAQQVTP
jgi:hypothetical protein